LPKNKTIAGVVTALLLLFFTIGVTYLFVLRFESGDVYPAYSSLRRDPLGTGALYESLQNIDRIAVRRNYKSLESVRFEPQTTLFYLGASAASFEPASKDMIAVIDRLTQSGGRLVLTFLPVTKRYEAKVKKSTVKKKEPVKKISKYRHWGIGLAFKETLPVIDDKHQAVDATANRKDLPPVISWHTNLYFELFDDAWQALYNYQGLPLIVERAYGKGSILLCADSFFMSNEALRSERHPQLLVWLIGGNYSLIFDEAHLGIYKNPSVAQLIRRYRFDWFFAALAVLAILFVWKSAAYFIPPPADDALNGADVVSEKDYTQGLIALLRRHIAGNQILPVCTNEWEQTLKKSERTRADTVERIRSLTRTGSPDSKKSRDPVMGYRTISKMISEEKRHE